VIVDFYTNLAPHYRASLWRKLLEANSLEAHFLYGEEPHNSIKQIDFTDKSWAEFSNRIHSLGNIRLKNLLVWQSGSVRRALKSPAHIVVLLDQMYILSNWMVLFISRLRGKKVAFWGHGIYGSETGVKRWLRIFYLKRADLILVYGPHARALLVKAGIPATRVECVYNSLDYQRHRDLRSRVIAPDFFQKAGVFSVPSRPTLIFVGRLTPQKKLNSLIDAVEYLQSSSTPVNLLFVGSGPEEDKLKLAASRLPGIVHFFGPCYDELQLGRLIANADLCVSPGEVGLTAIHCLSFGTPVCTHGDMTRQMPEADALTEGLTGVFYERSKMNLTETISNWFSSCPDREIIRSACYQTIDSKYNPDQQVEVFKRAFTVLNSEIKN
jgi:glycosyltransferase involved in cell wall biosynthesis